MSEQVVDAAVELPVKSSRINPVVVGVVLGVAAVGVAVAVIRKKRAASTEEEPQAIETAEV